MKQKEEITFKAIILGIILSMVLAGANAYLGLFAGMTVSASIPAAVISMGILSLFQKSNILENNIVQTAASAGESLAAGVIFTIPALILLGYWDSFNYWEVAKIAGIGGIIGVLFTVPLRRALIIEAKLQYPEGIATSEVLKAGEESKSNNKNNSKDGLKIIGTATLVGAIMKFASQALSMWSSSIEWTFVLILERFGKVLGKPIFGIGIDLSPALISVGYIVGRNIGILVFSGGLISWFIAIPIYSAINGYNGEPMNEAWNIWNTQIRYLGVGAMVTGGIWSLIKLIKPLISGIKSSIKSINNDNNSETLIHEQDFPINYVALALIILLFPLFLLYFDIIGSIKIAILLSLIMLIFGFLFSAVAAYMAGIVGSSNNPVSGVTIATILFSSLLLAGILGTGTTEGAAAAIMVGAVVCCAAAIGGDNLQDLKTGHILGATPWKQQIMQIIGTISSAIVLGLVLDILHTAYTIGSKTLSAPQATLMKSVSEGVFTGNLPWNMIIFGALIGIFIICLDRYQESKKSKFRIPVLAVAVGIYLPIELTVPIFIGGIINHLGKKSNSSLFMEKKGLLLSSGLITGEALMGIFVAIPIFITGYKNWWPNISGLQYIGPILFLMIIYWLYISVTEKS